MIATAHHLTGRAAALARVHHCLARPVHAAARGLPPGANPSPATDPLYAVCVCGHTFRAHTGHQHGHPCAAVGCPCGQFAPRAITGSASGGGMSAGGRHTPGGPGGRVPPAAGGIPPAGTVPVGTRGEVLGALADIEDAIEAGDRPRAREGMAHLRQALDSLPF